MIQIHLMEFNIHLILWCKMHLLIICPKILLIIKLGCLILWENLLCRGLGRLSSRVPKISCRWRIFFKDLELFLMIFINTFMKSIRKSSSIMALKNRKFKSEKNLTLLQISTLIFFHQNKFLTYFLIMPLLDSS